MGISWTESTIFRRIQGELATKTADDFERAVLRLLRLIWPDAVGTPRRRKFDRAGADHLVWSDDVPFPVVVQCKGWEVLEDEIGDSQIDQCLASIDSFRKGGLKTDSYILIHNRLGKNKAFREAVETALKTLVSSGLAARAELWSRQRVGHEAFETLYRRYLADLPRFNLSKIEIYNWMEQTNWEPIHTVPLESRILTVDQYRLVESGTKEQKTADPCREILNARERFFILLGPAGFGKSTTAFRLAREGANQAVYIPAASITKSINNTRELLRQAVSLESLLKDSSPDDYETHESVALVVIGKLLKQQSTPLMLIIDGLDESVFFNKPGGVQYLMNLLKDEDVRVPVLMTARSEYWHRKEADFSTSFGIQGIKGTRKVRDIRLVELQAWGENQMLGLVRRVRNETPEADKTARLDELEKLIAGGRYADFYGDIPKRPLFMRFIIETVLETDPHQVDRSQLVREWVRQKILRDVSNPKQFGGRRVPIDSETEVLTTIELAFLAMTHAASLMTKIEEQSLVLLPSCRFDSLTAAHPRLGSIKEPTGIVLNSLLIPVSVPLGDASHIGFAHRLFQEYFLGKAIAEKIIIVNEANIPSSVQEWIS